MPGDACARAAVRLFVSQFNPGPFYALLMSPEGALLLQISYSLPITINIHQRPRA